MTSTLKLLKTSSMIKLSISFFFYLAKLSHTTCWLCRFDKWSLKHATRIFLTLLTGFQRELTFKFTSGMQTDFIAPSSQDVGLDTLTGAISPMSQTGA